MLDMYLAFIGNNNIIISMQNNKIWFQSLTACQTHCEISSNAAAGEK